MQGVWVPSLVRELGSHINLRQKQYCNEFKKDFKNGPHQEKKKSSKKKQQNCLFRQCFQNSVKCLLENLFLDPASGVWLSTWDSLHQVLYSCSSQVHLLVLLPNPHPPQGQRSCFIHPGSLSTQNPNQRISDAVSLFVEQTNKQVSTRSDSGAETWKYGADLAQSHINSWFDWLINTIDKCMLLFEVQSKWRLSVRMLWLK